MSKSKYKRGRRINSISEFDACESLFYKYGSQTIHRSVLMSMQYRTLLHLISCGAIWTAELKTEEEE